MYGKTDPGGVFELCPCGDVKELELFNAVYRIKFRSDFS
jgi:hypothetical protein